VALYFSRRRKTEADRNRAAEMREKAEADQLAAREHEAKAARAESDAKAAEVEAERLRMQARGTQQEAAAVRAGAEEQFRRADDVDPDVVTTERGDARAQEVHTGETQPNEGLRRDEALRQNDELRRDEALRQNDELRRDEGLRPNEELRPNDELRPNEELRRDRGDRDRTAGTGDAAGFREETVAERRDTEDPHGGRPRNL